MIRVRRLAVNPLILKDGLARVRSWRAPVIIALYVGLLGIFAALSFSTQLTGFQRPVGYAQIGSGVFTALAMVQLALVCLVAPGLAAGAISGERERQTLDVLLVSCVPSFGIVWGKLVASVAFVLLLIVTALPLFAVVFLFGGIDGGQFLAAQLLTVTTALAVASLSLFLSALFRRTLPATVVAYGLTFGATAAAWFLGSGLLNEGHIRMGEALLFGNPIEAMLTVLHGPSPFASPFASPVGTPLVMAPNGTFLTGPVGLFGTPPPPWPLTVLVELAVVVLGVAGTLLFLRERPGLAHRPE
jgi:ABC-2 type transport system permease protein